MNMFFGQMVQNILQFMTFYKFWITDSEWLKESTDTKIMIFWLSVQKLLPQIDLFHFSWSIGGMDPLIMLLMNSSSFVSVDQSLTEIHSLNQFWVNIVNFKTSWLLNGWISKFCSAVSVQLSSKIISANFQMKISTKNINI